MNDPDENRIRKKQKMYCIMPYNSVLLHIILVKKLLINWGKVSRCTMMYQLVYACWGKNRGKNLIYVTFLKNL